MPDKNVRKAETSGRVIVPTSRETGQPLAITSSYFIQEAKKTELRMPARLTTFDVMSEDDAVFNSIDYTNLHVANALWKGKVVPKRTQTSKIAAEFLNYCLHNMSSGTWYEAVNSACADLKYGFSLQNFIIEKRNRGQYPGSYVLKKLSPRNQHTVAGWVWDDNFRDVIGFVQKPMTRQVTNHLWVDDGLTRLTAARWQETGYNLLWNNQYLHYRHNPSDGNPQGDPPLLHCYNAWKEKRLIEKYELVGVSKDLGGSIVLRVPSELIRQANDPANYPAAAAEYAALQANAAALHAGESVLIVLTSDTDDVSNKYLYDFDLKGIDGGGKQYNTSDIIDQKRKSIYNVFGTGFLLLGQSTVGSYNLSSSGTSTHGFYVERCINQKVDVINTQLIPRLLAANDIRLDWKDMPEFIPSETGEIDFDIWGKFIQRSKSVNALTKEALEYIYEKAGLPLDGLDEIDFSDKGQSRAGESMGTSGTGSSQQGYDASTANNENAATKSLVVDKVTDDEVVLIDTNTGNPLHIPR